MLASLRDLESYHYDNYRIWCRWLIRELNENLVILPVVFVWLTLRGMKFYVRLNESYVVITVVVPSSMLAKVHYLELLQPIA